MRYLLLMVVILCSCGGGGEPLPSEIEAVWSSGNGSYLYLVEVEGHAYVLFRGFESGGLTHHEGCKHGDHQ